MNLRDLMDTVPSDINQVEEYLQNPIIVRHMNMYEEYLHQLIQGSNGPMAQYWAIFIYLINRLYRELETCVKTNNVAGYFAVLPKVLDVFFALNRPNCARWGCLFLEKLGNATVEQCNILDNDA